VARTTVLQNEDSRPRPVVPTGLYRRATETIGEEGIVDVTGLMFI
jgi:hypothetical protein